MNLVDRARIDTQAITSNNGEFASLAVFTSPNDISIEVFGMQTIHHTALDDMGLRVNSKMASISVASTQFSDQDYPFRDGNGNVSLSKHKVSLTDSNGEIQTFQVQSTYPDETFGVITCILTQSTNG